MIDFNLNEGPATIMSDRDIVIQLIELLFDTVPGDILGDIHYGTRYDKYLYELKLSNSLIESAILSDLYNLDLKGYNPTVEVVLLNGTERDILLIKINLYKNTSNIEKIYKIS